MPGCFGCAQNMQAPAQSMSQQTPSLQWPLAHSAQGGLAQSADPQAVPIAAWLRQL